jgi:hypothetical protein
MLTKNQKIGLIESRMMALEISIYQVGLSILEEESKDEVNQEALNQFLLEKIDFALRLEVMTNKLNTVTYE